MSNFELKQNKTQKTPQKALEALRTSCSKMERTAQDAQRSLYRWMIDKSEWPWIIKSLMTDGYIDHARYAGCYVRDKINNSTWGLRKIRAMLIGKGIEPSIVDSAIDQYGQQYQSCNERLSKDLGRKAENLLSKPYKSIYQVRTKLFSWGASRGYDFDVINDEIDRILKSYE